jgi:hypothetical protein
MGQRIAALWIKDISNGKQPTGIIDAPAGICIPAGAKNIGVSIVKNEKTKDGQPDYFVELWIKDGGY